MVKSVFAVIVAFLAICLIACEDGGGSGFLLDSGADTDADTDTDIDTDTDSDTDTDTDSDTDSDTDTDTDSDTDSDSDTDTDMDAGPGCIDNDSDWWCLPFDCNDSDSTIYPGAMDWESDGINQDCDTETDEGAPDTDIICGETDLPLTIDHVKLMILLDYSGSMAGAKWTSAKSALYQILVAGSLPAGLVDFGFDYFPRIGTCGMAASVQTDCAWGTTHAANIYNFINAMPDPDGLTPMYLSMNQFINTSYAPVFLNTAVNPNAYLVLIADGYDYGWGTYSDTQLGNMASTLNSSGGVTTIMVGFGSGVSPSTLLAIANNGGYPSYPPAGYFTADNAAQLEAALQSIVNDVIPCIYPVPPPSSPDYDPDEVNFYFDGVLVPYNSDCNQTPPGVNVGWRWTTPAQNEVEFCTITCQEIKDGNVTDITATFGCPSSTS